LRRGDAGLTREERVLCSGIGKKWVANPKVGLVPDRLIWLWRCAPLPRPPLPAMTSRTDLLIWLNDLLQINYTKIDQRGNGGAYCQIMDSIYVRRVGLRTRL